MSNLVKPGYRSDHSLHSAVILEVKFNFVQRGKSQWKLKKKKTPVYSMINSTCIFKSYTKKKIDLYIVCIQVSLLMTLIKSSIEYS